VLGDDGALYVPADFVPVFRDELLPLATLATPNQTEAELLSGVKITCADDAARACAWFHRRGVPLVVITTLQYDGDDGDDGDDDDNGNGGGDDNGDGKKSNKSDESATDDNTNANTEANTDKACGNKFNRESPGAGAFIHCMSSSAPAVAVRRRARAATVAAATATTTTTTTTTVTAAEGDSSSDAVTSAAKATTTTTAAGTSVASDSVFEEFELSPSEQTVYTLKIPRLDAYYSGTGDLTAALLLAHR
jgi:pyridoxal/pyridoxine/pyridoxamine kinase